MMRAGVTTRRLVALAIAWAAPEMAAAQGANVAQPNAVQPTAVQQNAPGPMTVEEVRDGFAIAPDVKVTRLDGSTRTLGGLYGGWVIDDTLLVGAGGYFLTNGSSNSKLAYGGAVIEWRQHPSLGPITFGIRALAGYGQATLTSTVNLVSYGGYSPLAGPGQTLIPTPPPATTTAVVRFDEGFFVFEPQAELVVSLARWARLNVGFGYRAIGDADGMESRLRGASGGIALELGGSSYHTQHP
jgi:hypothetical protein